MLVSSPQKHLRLETCVRITYYEYGGILSIPYEVSGHGEDTEVLDHGLDAA